MSTPAPLPPPSRWTSWDGGASLNYGSRVGEHDYWSIGGLKHSLLVSRPHPPCYFWPAGFAAGAAVGIILLICVLILVCDRRRRPYIGSSLSQPPLGMFCHLQLPLLPLEMVCADEANRVPISCLQCSQVLLLGHVTLCCMVPVGYSIDPSLLLFQGRGIFMQHTQLTQDPSKCSIQLWLSTQTMKLSMAARSCSTGHPQPNKIRPTISQVRCCATPV